MKTESGASEDVKELTDEEARSKSDSDKLNAIADWLDLKYNETNGEVQQDLRRMAGILKSIEAGDKQPDISAKKIFEIIQRGKVLGCDTKQYELASMFREIEQELLKAGQPNSEKQPDSVIQILHEKLAILKRQQPNARVKKLLEKLDFELSLIPKKYADDYEDGVGIGIQKAINYVNEIFASHPAPDQPDGETQEELWQEVIEHFHAINDPTMINIPNEALKEFSIQRRKPNTK